MNASDAADELEVYGQVATSLSREALSVALAGRGIDVVPAAWVVRLKVNGERIELETMPGGFILSRNNDGPGWVAGLHRLSAELASLGIRHRFEFMKDNVLVESLHHDWPPAAQTGDAS